MAQQAQKKAICYQYYCLFRDETLGSGAYGKVCKATLDELPCAAKLLHPILVDRTDPKNQTNLRKFEQECRFLSEIRHPNIVQYLAVIQDKESGLPVLLMELMDESLTHFLEQSEKPLPYHVQVDISHDIALALAHLHSNEIIHRDLSSNNVLLIGPGYRAKITDFGMSKLSEMHANMTPLTKCPGTAGYMAPEALQDEPLYSKKLDVFQAGVLIIQIITRKFPDPDRATRRMYDPRSPTGVILVPVPETERRQSHISLIPQTHPMLFLALDCLKDQDKERPTTQQVCQHLSTLKEAQQYVLSRQEGREETRDDGGREREREDEGRMREVERKEIEVAGRERAVGGRETELERREREVWRRERDIEVRGEEIERRATDVAQRERGVERRVTEVVQRERGVERRVTEVGQREREVERRVTEVVRREREAGEITSKLQRFQEEKQQLNKKHRQMENQLREVQDEKDQLMKENHTLIQLLAEKDQIINGMKSVPTVSYTCHVSGPGLSATANFPTHVIVELNDASGQPCSLRQNIIVELQSVYELSVVPTTVSLRSPSQYEVSYTAARGGQYKLHVRLNGSEVKGSAFNITVYPDPTRLGQLTLVRTVRVGSKDLWGIAVNSRGEMVVSAFSDHSVSVLDRTGRTAQIYGPSYAYQQHQMYYPTGVAVDSDDNVYVASQHKLQKFSRDGHIIKCVGQYGSKDGEFKNPKGIRIHHGYIYVCDCDNDRIQVFDSDLNFILIIGSPGSGRGQFKKPYGLDFDIEGNAYIADFENNRIQVLDTYGQFVRQFGQHEGERPSAIHVMGQFVYVSNHNHIAAYQSSGQFVNTFKGFSEVDLFYITSDSSGFIYVLSNLENSKSIQVFRY